MTLNVDRRISPNDGMFAGNIEHYFACGESALRVLLEAIELAAALTPARILDYGAGAGRVTRWLRAAFPDAAISCCDLREGDMEFLRGLCGAETWPVGADIDALNIPGRYDLVWVGSVITHFSESKTKTLITRLLSACEPGGLVVLSFHGQFAVERHEGTPFKYIDDDGWQQIKHGYAERGYGYADYKPGWGADPALVRQYGYGVSVCTPEWMHSLVTGLAGSRLVFVKPRSWDGHHDVVAIQRMA
jgi:SAM-dependent methyltransferase